MPPRTARTGKTILVILLLALLLGAGWAWTPDLPRTELEARWAPPPSRFVDAAGLRWHVRDTGPAAGMAATPVLMLHGFGSSLHTWEAWAQGLQATHRVVRVDLPGAGLSAPDPQRRYDDTHAVQQLLALMDTLGLPRASLVGHSMGGRLAWRLAAEHPERVDRLVLVAPDGFESPGFEYGKPPDVGLMAQLLPHVLPRAFLRAGLEPAYADPARLDEDTVTRYHQMLLAPGVRGAIIDRLQQLRLQDPSPQLARVQAPTLLIWGERDAMIPVANAQDYLRALPAAATARLVALPGLGHVPHEEDPAAGLPAVQAFLTP
jgi:pimeloyl-ACP methyl ester carboxylesterase